MRTILKLLTFSFLIHIGTLLQAQQLVSTAGDYYQNNSGSLSFSLGELAIETFSSTNNILTQGFQQTNLVAVSIKELPGLDYEISVYPNPVNDIVILKVPADKLAGKQYRLYDTEGKLLQIKLLEETETEISFSSLTPATYFIKVGEGEKELKTFKIVKQ
jgi:hypothetical protein